MEAQTLPEVVKREHDDDGRTSANCNVVIHTDRL